MQVTITAICLIISALAYGEVIGTSVQPNSLQKEEIVSGVDNYKECINKYKQDKRDKIKEIDLTGAKLQEKDWENLKLFPNAEKIDLSYSNINDDGFKSVMSLNRVETIKLDEVKITDKSVVALNKLSNIKELSFEENDIRTDNIKQIIDNHRLIRLRIRFPMSAANRYDINEMCDEIMDIMQAVSENKTITSFDVGSMHVVNHDAIRRCMKQIANNKVIKELGVESGLTDNEVEYFGNNKNIIKLSITGDLSDKSLAVLQKMTQLESLNIRSDKITEEGVAKLLSSKQLYELNIRINNFGDKFIKSLGLQKNLKILDITCNNTYITEQMIDQILSITNLNALKITGKIKVAPKYIDHVLEKYPKIQIEINEIKPVPVIE